MWKLNLKALFIAVIIIVTLLTVVSEGRNRGKGGRRRSKSPEKRTEQEEATTTSATEVQEGRSSRRKEGRRHKARKNQSILKTSEKARIVTERRYLKRDWCKSQPVRQHVRTSSGCHAVIINQFCYGQCNSFYIPKDVTIDDNAEIVPDYFRSCSFCKPKSEEWISVRMRCKRTKNRKRPRFITKRMKRVKGCTCIAVPDLERLSEGVPLIDPEPPRLTALSNSTSTTRSTKK